MGVASRQRSSTDERRLADNDGGYRQELLAWCNGLLQLNMTKVEQCGTG